MTAAAVKLRDGQNQADSDRPWSVSQRRAFFERLQMSESINPSASSSKGVDSFRSKVSRVADGCKRFASCDKSLHLLQAVQVGICETKENVTPPPTCGEMFAVAAQREPPAKPRRTFAHGRELLRQATVSSFGHSDSPGVVPASSVNSTHCHPFFAKPPLPLLRCHDALRNLKPPHSSKHIASIQRQLFSSVDCCTRPPPLPPKPTRFPLTLKGRPTYFQLSHESDLPSSGQCTRAFAHEQWISDGYLVRYHSDESLYATPTPPKTQQRTQFYAQPMAQVRAMHNFAISLLFFFSSRHMCILNG
ncbi:unnamed protein product [Toxocara canis]|uniref:Uncharacterized protein n=1 Tax=Toxocara canis TaxID=6265 RepID=A0A183TWE8_TOXCA|nr:unnamed protein product [Toxocara canis]